MATPRGSERIDEKNEGERWVPRQISEKSNGKKVHLSPSLWLQMASTDVWQTRVLLTYDIVFTVVNQTIFFWCQVCGSIMEHYSLVCFCLPCFHDMDHCPWSRIFICIYGSDQSYPKQALDSQVVHPLSAICMRITVNTGDTEKWTSVLLSRTQSKGANHAHTIMTTGIRLFSATQ